MGERLQLLYTRLKGGGRRGWARQAVPAALRAGPGLQPVFRTPTPVAVRGLRGDPRNPDRRGPPWRGLRAAVGDLVSLALPHGFGRGSPGMLWHGQASFGPITAFPVGRHGAGGLLKLVAGRKPLRAACVELLAP